MQFFSPGKDVMRHSEAIILRAQLVETITIKLSKKGEPSPAIIYGLDFLSWYTKSLVQGRYYFHHKGVDLKYFCVPNKHAP